MQKNKLNIVVALIIISLVLGFILLESETAKDGVVKIGMSQTISHAVFDEDIRGMKEVLAENGYIVGKNLSIEIENGQGDVNILQAIANKLAKSDKDIVVSLGTQASQSITNLVKDKPVVFTAVTDPVKARLVDTIKNPGANVTGATDATNYELQLSIFKKLIPTLSKVGVVYNPGEVNSVSAISEISKVGKEMGIEIFSAPVNNANEVLFATKSLAPRVDGFFSIGDNTVLAAEVTLIRVATESKKPVFTIVSDGVEKGGLASVSGDYYKLGRKTGEIILRIIDGEKPGNISVVGFTEEDVDLHLNQKTADLLGITFPEELLKQANKIYK